ncbi:hypothetical protein BJ875DRAFT_287320 [Amylocarpus encephaloides]|uniref:FHA domain-containing protein n=1 Tax=Amylocarpus encephaloides TaxID=45428 RepID=A0A9P7YK24_9HELO|nr:hypothetical protein BJ875DRAFT_287320 [Amylocarpus encephaloides]
MDSSPSKLNVNSTSPPVAGVKRLAPSLLPAFEPFSSSPSLPRPYKRQALASPRGQPAYAQYPTPIPTSTTGIISSSPPRVQGRPTSQRSASNVSERAPLSAVRSVALPENGEILRMGRSSASSDYQLSANRLISRVHVEARYIAASVPLESSKIEITCKGWNGVKLHYEGRTRELAKDQTFVLDNESAGIMMDVQDARVLIAWPDKDSGAQTDSSWDDDISPSRRAAAATPGQIIQSSPLYRSSLRLESPVSPTPARASHASNSLDNLFSSDAEPDVVKVYEDPSSAEDDLVPKIVAGQSMLSTQAATSFPRSPFGDRQSSDLSEPEVEHNPDEENDPIVHSFGPFGDNLSARMASFTHGGGGAPEVPVSKRRMTTTPGSRSDSEDTNEADVAPIVNHAINQLAFSRLSSTPLSVILNHLPADLKGASPMSKENKGLSKEDLSQMLNRASCVGEIHREGKDAAGKPLESEYYYIPDEDIDEQRKAAVDGLRKPSLRNCRKQHKQYYWKRPRTP